MPEKKEKGNAENKSSKLVSATHVSDITVKDLQTFAGSFGFHALSMRTAHAVSVYSVVYRTTYKKEIKASGLLFLPNNLHAPAPLLSAQHGTTFRKADAPSVSKAFNGMEFLAAAGYITLMPDYIGYGSSADIFHPYYEESLSAYTVIDMIIAVKEFLDSKNITYGNKLFLAGYSEGGYVTLAAQKAIENTPSLNLKLTAVAAGAGGFDLYGMLQAVSDHNYFSFPAYLAFILEAYNQYYDWKKPLNYFFKDQYASKLTTLLDGSHEGWYVNNQLPKNMDELFNSEFYSNLKGNGEMQLKKVLFKNTLLQWKPATPLRLYHGTDDEIIPYRNSEETYNRLKANGAKEIHFVPIKNASHGTALVPMIASFMPWFHSFLRS